MWYQDADEDGLGNPEVSQESCDQPDGYVSNSDDTDDTCVGMIDECGICEGQGAFVWYQDADEDGLGNPDVSEEACDQPDGYVSNSDDTDDTCVGMIDECGICEGQGASVWYQDADEDGLGNPDVSEEACDQPDGYVSNSDDTDDTGGTTSNALHSAFSEFDTDNTDIYLDGSNVVIETNGEPNHTTPYWGVDHELYVETTVATRLTPSLIPNFDASATLRVSTDPQLASSSTSTSLGPIGIAVSGAAIFNDSEGNGPLSNAIVSIDYAGGHIGPGVYHYHLEPTPLSSDDDNLVGIISDGFFIYGRKCNSTGTYPTDLDDSGGHIAATQHTDEAEYHYHIINEAYLGAYILLFGGDYQGTPNSIN